MEWLAQEGTTRSIDCLSQAWNKKENGLPMDARRSCMKLNWRMGGIATMNARAMTDCSANRQIGQNCHQNESSNCTSNEGERTLFLCFSSCRECHCWPAWPGHYTWDTGTSCIPRVTASPGISLSWRLIPVKAFSRWWHQCRILFRATMYKNAYSLSKGHTWSVGWIWKNT